MSAETPQTTARPPQRTAKRSGSPRHFSLDWRTVQDLRVSGDYLKAAGGTFSDSVLVRYAIREMRKRLMRIKQRGGMKDELKELERAKYGVK